MTVIDGPLQLSYNGTVLGQTGITIEDVQGLDSLPDIRTYDKDRALVDGQFSGRDLLSKRAITVTGNVWGNDATELRSRLTALTDATVPQPAELPLVAQLPGYPFTQLVIKCRCRKRDIDNNIDYGRGDFAPYALLFEATDPRIYDSVQQSAATAAAVTGGGLDFPLTFPLSFGGTGTSGVIQAQNTGNYWTPWTATVTGPCTNPQFENQTTGQIIRADLTLGATDTLYFNADLSTIVLNGTATRKDAQSSDSSWWLLPPGTTPIRFSSASGGTATVSWYSARI